MPELRLDVTTDATAAAAGLDSVGAAARGMATDVDTASAAAGTGASSMDALAGAGDAAASKASQATGAFGALAGGLEAAGFEKQAMALQGVAVATDFASGAGDLLNLVMETQAVKMVAAKVAAVASAVATGAQTAATTVATGAQWAWNAALTANPIGLVVAGVALLVGGLVLAYNKVEPFRDIVDSAMGVAKDAIDAVWGGLETLVGWVGDAAGGWDAIKSTAEDALSPVTSAVDAVSTALSNAVGWVQDLIGWISRIDFPDLPGWIPGADRNARGLGEDGTITRSVGGEFAPLVPITIQLTAATQDQDRSTEAMVDALRDYFARRGMTLSLTQP